jgi:hypothetical protein
LDKNNQALLFNDNKAMINFVDREGTAKGVHHMERRMWYTRDKYLQVKIKLEYLAKKVTHVITCRRYALIVLPLALPL